MPFFSFGKEDSTKFVQLVEETHVSVILHTCEEKAKFDVEQEVNILRHDDVGNAAVEWQQYDSGLFVCHEGSDLVDAKSINVDPRAKMVGQSVEHVEDI